MEEVETAGHRLAELSHNLCQSMSFAELLHKLCQSMSFAELSHKLCQSMSFVEISHKLCKCELPVASDTKENLEGLQNIHFPSMVMLVARPLLHCPG